MQREAEIGCSNESKGQAEYPEKIQTKKRFKLCEIVDGVDEVKEGAHIWLRKL